MSSMPISKSLDLAKPEVFALLNLPETLEYTIEKNKLPDIKKDRIIILPLSVFLFLIIKKICQLF